MTTPPTSGHGAQRSDWMGVLATASFNDIRELADPLLAEHAFEWLREPEHGLMMVRARIGNSGDRFNLGECTVTRCSVLHPAPDGLGIVGTAHVLGRSAGHAQSAARMDALLQRPDLQPLLYREVIERLRQRKALRDHAHRMTADATRVRFLTLHAEAS